MGERLARPNRDAAQRLLKRKADRAIAVVLEWPLGLDWSAACGDPAAVDKYDLELNYLQLNIK